MKWTTKYLPILSFGVLLALSISTRALAATALYDNGTTTADTILPLTLVPPASGVYEIMTPRFSFNKAGIVNSLIFTDGIVSNSPNSILFMAVRNDLTGVEVASGTVSFFSGNQARVAFNNSLDVGTSTPYRLVFVNVSTSGGYGLNYRSANYGANYPPTQFYNTKVGGHNDDYATGNYVDFSHYGSSLNGVFVFQAWGDPTYGDNGEKIEFAYPYDGLPTPIFSDTLLVASNLLTLSHYEVRLQYRVNEIGSATSSLTNNISTQGTGQELEQYGISLPMNFLTGNLTFQNDTTLSMLAQIFNIDDPTRPVVLNTAELTATLLARSSVGGSYDVIPTFTNGTTSLPTVGGVAASYVPPGTIKPPTLNIVGDCDPNTTFDLWHSADWKCAILNTAQTALNNASDFSTQMLKAIADKLKVIFPISVYTNINTDIDAAAATSTGAIMLTGHGDVLPDLNVELLSTGMIDDISNKINFDIRAFTDKVMYVLTGLVILEITIIATKKLIGHSGGGGGRGSYMDVGGTKYPIHYS